MTTDFSVTLTRFCCLFWPSFVLVLLIIRRRPNPRLSGAALVATLWNLCALLILNRLAISQQWWSYHTQSGLFMGMPGDLLLGWALLWGAIPALAFQNRPLWQSLLLLLITDLILMPACTPVITLGTQWLLGEALAITIALLPSLFLTRWILYKTFLKAKVILLVVGYTCLMLFVLPSLILEQTKSSWETALTRPLEFSGLILQLTFLVAIPALSAVQEFFQRGVGTPLPFDPPRRMVTS